MNVRTKILVAIVLLVYGISMASAQKVESKSRSFTVEKTKTHHPLSWLIKAGLGVTVSNGYESSESGFNYDIALGFKSQFTSDINGWYWGGLLGFTERDYETQGMGFKNGVHYYYGDYDLERKGSLYVGPMVGLNKPINDLLTFDAHLMAGYQYSFSENYKHHVLAEIGIGMWIRRFLVEIDYQPSFIGDCTCNSFLLNLGYRF